MTDQVPDGTVDEREELLRQIRELVPAAFPDGELDGKALLNALEVESEDGERAGFAFSWPGIEEARADARAATTATLVPDQEASLNWESARDVLIEGDNLQVLKLLKSGYSGAAKLIYIDPPYNTGETFTYNDDFSIVESEYFKQTGQVDDQGNVTTSKLERAGKKHAPWLSLMFPRLAVARHLLKRDGVILISIDDNEVHHLRLLMDAVFGASNFVGNLVWNGGRKNDARRISTGHDYILVYARDLVFLKEQDVRWRERKTGLAPVYAKVEELREEFGDDYDAATEGLREWFKSLPDADPSKAHKHYRVIDQRGVYFPSDLRSPNPRPTLVYSFRGYEPHENGWAYGEVQMEALAEDDRIVYPKKKDGRLQLKSYLHEHEEWAPASVFYRDRRAASKALASLMGAEVFDYPKDTGVLGRLFESMTSDGDLIIDFFAGSGSTGQAIWDQDKQDGVTRNWVLVQAPELPDDSEFGKNARKEGYKTIFEITAERLRRSAANVDSDKLGFRVFRTEPTKLSIDKPIVAAEGMTGEDYVQESLLNVKQAPVVDGASDESVAWEVVLKATGSRLDAQVTTHDVGGVTVYEFVRAGEAADGRLFVSLDAFTVATADELALDSNDTLILRGDVVDDSTTLTLAPRMQKNLVLLERVAREVSL